MSARAEFEFAFERPEHWETSGHLREALRLLGIYTAGTFSLWQLAGPAKASCRAHIATALAGRKVPQSKAGVSALRDSFYACLRPAGDCIAAREDGFRALAGQFLLSAQARGEAAR